MVMANQDELDALSAQLAPLNTDELCVTVTNSRIQRGTTPVAAIRSFVSLISLLSSFVEDADEQQQIASLMRDLATQIAGGNRLVH